MHEDLLTRNYRCHWPILGKERGGKLAVQIVLVCSNGMVLGTPNPGVELWVFFIALDCDIVCDRCVGQCSATSAVDVL
jgi:hypothetical protein